MLTDQQLLERIEIQAVQIAELKKEIKEYQERIAWVLKEMDALPKRITHNLAKLPVNCNGRSVCSLVSRE